MTTTTAELCGHRWQVETDRVVDIHQCAEPAGHTRPCRCRQPCGATTTREEYQ